MKDEPIYQVEIVEQNGGWWAGEIWSTDNRVYTAHATSKETAEKQAIEALQQRFKFSTVPGVTFKYLRSN